MILQTFSPTLHYETYSCELCGNDSHCGYDCPPQFPLVYEQEQSYNQNFSDNYYPQNLLSFPQQYLCCENCGGPHESFQCQLMNQNYFKPNYSGFDRPLLYPIDQSPPQEMSIQDMIDELKGKFNGMSIEINKKKELRQLEQTANLSTYTTEPSRRFNSFYDDDDYEESTIPLNEIVSQIPPFIAITPDEVIKSSIEDLVPIPSEFEDTSRSDSECNLPSYVSKVNAKIYSNPLFEFDDEYISSDVNTLFDEVLEEIESMDSYVSNLDEPALLVTPLSDANEDECFDPGGEIDKINAFLDMDISTDIENGYHDLEGDIIYLEILLVDDTIPNLPPKVFLDHDPKNLKDEPDNEDLKSMVKDCPDYEDSRAHSFVHRSLDLQSLALLIWESDILDLIN
ncbi:hypothetical protein Tco_1020772 [Tanacetum coccineum]